MKKVHGAVATIKCSVEGCDRDSRTRGFCCAHYQRFLATGSPGSSAILGKFRKKEMSPYCVATGCNTKSMCRNLCKFHYGQWIAGENVTGFGRRVCDPCSVAGCTGIVHSFGKCGRHYRQELMKSRPQCAFPGCHRKVLAKGWCPGHYSQQRLGKTQRANTPKAAKGSGSICGGYRIVQAKGHPNARKRREELAEHRLIMSVCLGRPLVKGETVHHKNGVRSDNRLVKGHEIKCPGTCCNLELWSKTQPSGQRVMDKIAFATDLLALYAPERLSEAWRCLQTGKSCS